MHGRVCGSFGNISGASLELFGQLLGVTVQTGNTVCQPFAASLETWRKQQTERRVF